MQSATLRGRRGVAYRRAIPARVSGWQLVFDKPGFAGTGEAYANIVPVPRARVYGVLFEVSADDHAHVELTEGVLIGAYQRVTVTATALTTGTRRRCYSLSSPRRAPDTRPTTRYMQVVIDGAEEHGLPSTHIAALRAVEAIPESTASARLRPLFDQFLRRR